MNHKRIYSPECKVTKVIDGDTIQVDMYLFPNLTYSNIRVRLDGINAEELKSKSERAYQAKQALEALILDKNVIVEFRGLQSFNRYIGKVYLESDVGEVDVSKYLLDNKLVDVYVAKPKL
jgi:endonuclease YncB( thermonuclease family)